MCVAGPSEPISTTESTPTVLSELLCCSVIVNYQHSVGCFKYVVFYTYNFVSCIIMWHDLALAHWLQKSSAVAYERRRKTTKICSAYNT